ncbi:MAG: metallophosphoesterase, partial [Acidobacteria bacterium]|nr:metallophosphoesterase [Acidobacteriota bacterium]
PWFVLLLLTLPSTGEAQKVTLAVWGDSRENLDRAASNIASILLHDVTDWDVTVHTGDFTQDGSEEAWQRSLRYPGIAQLFVAGRILVSTSNHDDNATTWDRHTAGVLPTNTADGTTHFYAWKKGNVHVVVCDGYFTRAKTMKTWLDGYLATVKADEWVIGLWHDPSYGDLSYKPGYLKKAGPWLKSLYARGGDLILNGHAHVYVRTRPLLPDGTVDDTNGMVHIINGAGGASWKDPILPNPKIAFTPAVPSFPCVTFLTFEGARVSLETIDARPGQNGRVIDRWSSVRRPRSATPER